MVSISACHAEDPGSIPGRGVYYHGYVVLTGRLVVLRKRISFICVEMNSTDTAPGVMDKSMEKVEASIAPMRRLGRNEREKSATFVWHHVPRNIGP